MEADWEIELGVEAPVIDACWRGFVDLRMTPARVRELAEVRQLPALSDVLLRLNGPTSSLWTAKCDVWTPASVDRYELDALPEQATAAKACYVDLLPRTTGQWPGPEQVGEICARLCAALRAVPLRCCRADLIVRSAQLAPETEGLGITAYLTACGPSEAGAMLTLAGALVAMADSLATLRNPPTDKSKLQ